ncbi:MAG TPA: hypothetical protein VJZ00_11835 [Thermoanaerobaculia bacterium]|nr:hypothetical protein [Thermoanaerobaculia bacterium]
MTIRGATEPIVDQHLFLIGRPPVGDFLRYYRNLAVDAGARDEGQLMHEWRTANDRVRELETTEAGLADDPPILPLPPELREHEAAVLSNAIFRKAFRLVPVRIAMVELDRMVVYQKHINLSYVREIHRRLGEGPLSPEAVFRMCISLEDKTAPIRVARTAPNSYTFVSPSPDFRYVEPVLLDCDQVLGYEAMGPVTAVLGVVVGYGANYMNALHVQNRLILSNGSHRAFALRERGITRVPCVVQQISRPEELEVSASDEVRNHTDRYLGPARPPMLQDYFDDKLRKVIDVARKDRMIQLSFGVDVSDIPAQ